jgi:hypothetical protein
MRGKKLEPVDMSANLELDRGWKGVIESERTPPAQRDDPYLATRVLRRIFLEFWGGVNDIVDTKSVCNQKWT